MCVCNAMQMHTFKNNQTGDSLKIFTAEEVEREGRGYDKLTCFNQSKKEITAP